MTKKELRKMNRRQLIELMLEQSRLIDSLEARLEKAEAQLSERELIMQESGSIAEAAMRLNGVFQAAQDAADQYLASIRSMADRS